ncbi:MtrAB system histidine kinase MtrB [Homoserinibacter sp. GY 40078]|uniref:MtrAB system histidine kinase MtrB n=1 Tax=Homoserinibacter sp. GY 40078 TaxID=2603275 RepID=UPI0011C98D7C|nr:MtrAB system histidine kinase MtrB [Homoserinibacter sp. GY 40078]TXK16295.1 HAMP domain-containing histidine kinase [Homoserinibacter sp. GY 40078]
MRWDWRAWRDRLVHVWRGSLRARTIVITVVLSAIAVTVIGVVISTSVRSNLFDSRREQVISEAGRATEQAQQMFTSAEGLGESVDVEATVSSAIQAVQLSTTAAYTALLWEPGQDIPQVVDNRASRDFLDAYATPQLRAQVSSGGVESISWQSVALVDGGGADPGITTGSLLDTFSGGRYQLFLVYDLSDVQQTLDFVQSTLLLGGIALVVLFGGVAYLIVRLVVGPVRIAADVSEKLAEGDLEERLPVRGEDELATLARSFNRMADSLQTQIRRLAELSRVQQRFVSDVSHELRTPLTTIRLAGDVLYDQRERFPAPTARTAELLHAQVERFEEMLSDLLEMSRYDAGAVELETDPTNLVRLVEESIQAVEPLARERGTEIRLVAPGGYFEADVDVRRIRRILQNLLGNAIDHGESKPIVVYVDSDERAAAIAVRDYGIGMEPQDVERVFDRFWRADPSRQRTTGGTGLGLAISLEDAAVHGGELAVWSEPGGGSCFRLTLPRRRGDVLDGASPLGLPPDGEVPA